MPYDPTHPINGEIVDADELRGKFEHAGARIDRGMSFTDEHRAVGCRP